MSARLDIEHAATEVVPILFLPPCIASVHALGVAENQPGAAFLWGCPRAKLKGTVAVALFRNYSDVGVRF